MAKFWTQYRRAPDPGLSPALRVYTIHRNPTVVGSSRPNSRYRHVLDLGFSPASHVSTIHREISSSPLIVGNSWPNFGHSIDMHLTSAQALLYVSIRFILKFPNSPLPVENS